MGPREMDDLEFQQRAHYAAIFLREGLTGKQLEEAINRAVGRSMVVEARANRSVGIESSRPVQEQLPFMNELRPEF